MKSLPRTLDETYEHILLSISEDDFDFASNALLWIAFSEKPMTVEAVAEAVSVKPGESSLDPDRRLIDPNDILEICGSLIVVINEDTRNDYVKLAHYSVKEYLVSDRIEAKELSKFAESIKYAQQQITKVCLTYLSLDCFLSKSKSETKVDESSQYPLLKYVSENWFKHLSLIEHPEIRNHLEGESLEILGDGGSRFRNWIPQHRPGKIFGRDPMYGAAEHVGSVLFYFASFGLEAAVRNKNYEMVDLLLRYNADTYLQHAWNPPITLAICQDDDLMVHKLLEYRASPWKGRTGYVDSRIQLPLPAACKRGNAARLLLEKGAGVNGNTYYGYALYYAVRGRHESIINLLLGYGANPFILTPSHRSAAGIVAARGDAPFLQRLLSVDTVLQVMKWEGRRDFLSAELASAALYCHIYYVKLLLEHGADPNGIFSPGRDVMRHVLHYACSGGSMEVIQLLLGHGAEIDDVPSTGSTSENDKENIDNSRYLSLYNKTLSPAKSTLLRAAVRGGSAPLVQFLLDRAPDDDIRRGYAQLALNRTTRHECSEVLDILLSAGVDIKTRSRGRFTILHETTRNGEVEMAEILLDRGADPNAVSHTDADGSVYYKAVLESPNRTNITTENGCTALHIAVQYLNLAAAKTLLERVRTLMPDLPAGRELRFA